MRSEPGVKVRDVTVLARDAEHIAAVAAAAEELASVEVEHVSDRTFLLHLGGKIEMALKAPLVDARRPLDGVHAGRRARLARRSRTTRRRRGA